MLYLYLVSSYAMIRISFLSRVALICNICLLLGWATRYFSFLPRGHIESTVLIAGFFLSFVVNGVVNILCATLLLRKKAIADYVPVWLALINFLFLILQLYLILVK